VVLKALFWNSKEMSYMTFDDQNLQQKLKDAYDYAEGIINTIR